MDYLNRMNEALDYIERNLDGEIDYKKVSTLPRFVLFYCKKWGI